MTTTAEVGTRRPLALVLSGGGSKGALQAGMYRALVEADLEPDLVVGTSVGAVNGALIAAGIGPDALAAGWTRLSRGDLFRFNWSVLWRGLRAESLFGQPRFRRFLEARLPVRRFEELSVPLHVVSTHLSAGTACTLSEGDLLEALLASCAVPGLLPPVEMHGGAWHVDGSLGDNLPVRLARELGASRVVALGTRTCDRCDVASPGVTEVIGRAFGIAADCSLRRMADSLHDDPDLLLIQPDLAECVYTLDFSRSEWLVEEGYRYAAEAIDAWLSGPRTSGTRSRS